jgi:hypothetical protein
MPIFWSNLLSPSTLKITAAAGLHEVFESINQLHSITSQRIKSSQVFINVAAEVSYMSVLLGMRSDPLQHCVMPTRLIVKSPPAPSILSHENGRSLFFETSVTFQKITYQKTVFFTFTTVQISNLTYFPATPGNIKRKLIM